MAKAKAIILSSLASLALAAALTACSSDNSSKGADKAQPAAQAGKDAPATLNIRYIDGDSVSANFQMAKDLNDKLQRSAMTYQKAEQAKSQELQALGQQIETKLKNNQYLNEEAYNADMAKFSKMQQDAQSYLANLQRQTEQEIAAQQQQLTDTITAFIKVYNQDKGYDAILFKAAGIYFNESLDITDEVVEGLNARYGKKK